MNVEGLKSIATQPVFEATRAAGGSAAKPEGESGFGNLLKAAVGSVDARQHDAAATVQQLLAGKDGDVLPVVQAVAKADMSFKLLVGVRNKMIEAYKQTINMQI